MHSSAAQGQINKAELVLCSAGQGGRESPVYRKPAQNLVPTRGCSSTRKDLPRSRRASCRRPRRRRPTSPSPRASRRSSTPHWDLIKSPSDKWSLVSVLSQVLEEVLSRAVALANLLSDDFYVLRVKRDRRRRRICPPFPVSVSSVARSRRRARKRTRTCFGAASGAAESFVARR